MRPLVVVLLSVLLVTACDQESRESSESSTTTEASETRQTVSLTPEELGELGARIQKDPANAKKMLEEKGLNEASFEEAVREVTEDPEASKRYAEAYRNNS